jgi:hypothetical protein
MTQGLPAAGIAPLAPEVQIDPGQNLDNDSNFVREAIQTFIPFSSSEDEFVNTGLRQLFRHSKSYVLWRASESNAAADWGPAIRTSVALRRLEFEVRGSTKAATTEEILDTHEEILRWTNITAADRGLMKILSEDEKIQPLMFDLRTLKLDIKTGKPTEIWGIYDYPLRLAQAEELGYAWDSLESREALPATATVRQTYLTAGRDYYTSRAKSYRGLNVLPYNPELDSTLDRSVTAFIRTELTGIESFTKDLNARIQKVSQQPAAERPRFDLNTYNTFTGPFLDPSVQSSFDNKMANFHQSTNNCFNLHLGTPACPDFAP